MKGGKARVERPARVRFQRKANEVAVSRTNHKIELAKLPWLL